MANTGRLVDALYAEAIKQDIPMHELSKKSIAKVTKAYKASLPEFEQETEPETE
ncbi:MAG TPA: hypothetical protein VMW00_06310 [Dehalococcoidales bacterium]|nr:hypothetical protein [Dehalococcoidales bacterium]